MRGRKPANDISTTRTRPRTPKATAERKAAEHLAGRVFSLHGGEVKPEDKPPEVSTAVATFAAVWSEP